MTQGDFQKPIAARVCLAGTRAAYFGESLDLSPHRNVAATIAVGFDTPFALRVLDEDRTSAPWRDQRVALIPPGALHHLRARGRVGFLYLDPASDDHRRLAELQPDGGLSRLEAQLEHMTVLSVGVLCAALEIPQRRIGDARVATAVRAIDARPEDFTTIDQLADLVGLSQPRFRALFNRHVGLPFRRYRLWRRMAWVMRALKAGQSLTEAAHRAGFASSAHLSTTFRETFGLSPSVLIKAGIEIDLTEDVTGAESAGAAT